MSERIKGSFPDLFKRYYDEMDQGVRDPRGFVIKHDRVCDKVMDGWLATGIKKKEASHGS